MKITDSSAEIFYYYQSRVIIDVYVPEGFLVTDFITSLN